MIYRPSRRDIVKTTAKLATVGALGAGHATVAPAEEPVRSRSEAFSQIDSMLRDATSAEDVPGVVALAAPTMASFTRGFSAGAGCTRSTDDA